MDSESQNGGAKPKLKLKSNSKSNKPKLQVSKKNKGKAEIVATALGTSAGKTIIQVKNKVEGKDKSKDKKITKDNTLPEKKEKSPVNKTNIKEDKDDNKGKSKPKSKEKSKEKSKPKTKPKSKSSSHDIIDLSNPQLDSREYDYQHIIMNYNINNNQSINVLTQYEVSVIIGKRASQIAMGALPLIKVTPNMNHIDIAEEELRQKKTPFIIKREIGQHAEYWKIADLELYDTI